MVFLAGHSRTRVGGYKGERVRHDPKDPKTAFDLLKIPTSTSDLSTHKSALTGASGLGDWANPLIGHMQYSQRDPNRDHIHGRVYRLFYKNKPLLKPDSVW